MSNNLQEVISYYEFQLRTDEWNNFGGRTNLDHICILVQQPGLSTDRIVDVGCGDGDVAQALRDCGIRWSEYLGIDAVPELVDRFNARKVDKSRAIIGDVIDLSAFADQSINLVLCLFLLQDLSRTDGEKLMEHVARILTPGGHAIWALAITSQSSFESRGAPAKLKVIGSPEKDRLTWGERDFDKALQLRGFIEQGRREDPNPTHTSLTELYLLTKKVAQAS
jgi:ubiquinone/menaquinone biosynthesis C-methylase UbiE